jgi:hypothetical protein
MLCLWIDYQKTDFLQSGQGRARLISDHFQDFTDIQ